MSPRQEISPQEMSPRQKKRTSKVQNEHYRSFSSTLSTFQTKTGCYQVVSLIQALIPVVLDHSATGSPNYNHYFKI